HSSPAAPHAVPGAAKPSAGQLSLVPSQVSARSQAPAAARHTLPAGCLASAGQLVLVPSQLSAASQAPAAARHTVPAWPAGCWQLSALPSHWSSVHGLPSSVHAVPLACLASAGHVALEPVQCSATSHSPAAARQTVLAEVGRAPV